MAFRDWLNARQARRIARRQPLPDTIERAYWRATDYEKDSRRLDGLGYVVASETENAPYVTGASVARGETSGYYSGRTMRRRVPSYHVIYERRRTTSTWIYPTRPELPEKGMRPCKPRLRLLRRRRISTDSGS